MSVIAKLLSANVLIAFVFCGASAAEAGAKDDYQRGYAELKAGHYEQAASWYSKAADQGYAEAQWALGALYEFGNGVPLDFKKALGWYQKSADLGFAQGQANLGTMYESGKGTDLDYQKALFWYRKSAELGNSSGEFHIGNMYAFGHGVPQDYQQALIWYRKAAQQGHAGAEGNLGTLYYYGHGVKSDFSQAFIWYTKAAEGGDSLAARSLGAMYGRGETIPRDPIESYKWLAIAVVEGNTDAAQQRDIVASTMTSNQLSLATQKANQWINTYNARQRSGQTSQQATDVSSDPLAGGTWCGNLDASAKLPENSQRLDEMQNLNPLGFVAWQQGVVATQLRFYKGKSVVMKDMVPQGECTYELHGSAGLLSCSGNESKITILDSSNIEIRASDGSIDVYSRDISICR